MDRLLFAIAFAALLCVLPNIPAPVALAAGAPPALSRSDDGAAVAPDALERALAQSGVLARLPAGAALHFFGASLTGAAASAVFLSASADLVFAACLEGAIRAGEAEAGPGELILWRPGGAAPETFDFEVKRLLATITLPLDTALQTRLDALVAHQKRLIFWGALQRSALNVQAIGTAGAASAQAVEPLRRQYLRRPAVIRLRLRHATVEGLTRGVAEAFVAALARQDAEAIADLLSPRLFAQGIRGRGESVQSVLRLRRAFAERIAGQNWRARLAAAPKIEATGGNAVWYVAGKPLGFTITLEGFDRFPFVSAIETVTEPPNIKPREQTL